MPIFHLYHLFRLYLHGRNDVISRFFETLAAQEINTRGDVRIEFHHVTHNVESLLVNFNI